MASENSTQTEKIPFNFESDINADAKSFDRKNFVPAVPVTRVDQLPYKLNSFTDDEFINKVQIGKGGQARIEIANHRHFRTVVLKRYEGPVEKAEIQYLTELRHSNILEFFGLLVKVNDCNQVICIGLVLEYMENGCVEDAIKSSDIKYYKSHVLSWSYHASQALAYMHSRKILHRDVKPLNMLLKNRYVLLKVCDFGLAKALNSGGKALSQFVGTEGYRAPEVYLRHGYDEAIDVASFGKTLEEIADGCSEELDEQIRDFIRKAQSENPQDRPTMDELKDYFEIESLKLPPHPIEINTTVEVTDNIKKFFAAVNPEEKLEFWLKSAAELAKAIEKTEKLEEFYALRASAKKIEKAMDKLKNAKDQLEIDDQTLDFIVAREEQIIENFNPIQLRLKERQAQIIKDDKNLFNLYDRLIISMDTTLENRYSMKTEELTLVKNQVTQVRSDYKNMAKLLTKNEQTSKMEKELAEKCQDFHAKLNSQLTIVKNCSDWIQKCEELRSNLRLLIRLKDFTSEFPNSCDSVLVNYTNIKKKPCCFSETAGYLEKLVRVIRAEYSKMQNFNSKTKVEEIISTQRNNKDTFANWFQQSETCVLWIEYLIGQNDTSNFNIQQIQKSIKSLTEEGGQIVRANEHPLGRILLQELETTQNCLKLMLEKSRV